MHFLGVRFLPASPFCFDQWQLLTHCDVYPGDHACFSEQPAGKVGATTLGSLYLPPAERSSILQVINRYHDYYSITHCSLVIVPRCFQTSLGGLESQS